MEHSHPVVVFVLKAPRDTSKVSFDSLDIVKQYKYPNSSRVIHEKRVGKLCIKTDGSPKIGTLESVIPVESEEYLFMIKDIMPRICQLAKIKANG